MPNLPPPGMSPPLPGGLCLSPGLGSLSGVAAPPDKAAGAQRAGVGRGLTGPPPVTVATARGGPLKGPRHRGHRAGQGHKGHGPAVLASPPRAAAEPPPSGISGPSQPPALVGGGGDSVGSPQLSCAPPLPPPLHGGSVSPQRCHVPPCSPHRHPTCMAPPHIALRALSPDRCFVTPRMLRVPPPPPQPWVHTPASPTPCGQVPPRRRWPCPAAVAVSAAVSPVVAGRTGTPHVMSPQAVPRPPTWRSHCGKSVMGL